MLTPRTEHTIASIPRLRRELEMVRARGWADNVNEVEIGVASVAAPIRNASGEVVAAVSAESVYASQEEFAAQLRRDRERYGVVIRAAGIRAE